jgi:hypothetical protein
LGGGDEVRVPSWMTRAPLLRLGGADGGSCLTVLGVDADDRDADLTDPEDADPEETDAIRRGIQELPRRRDSVGRYGNGISRTGEFPRSMCDAGRMTIQLGTPRGRYDDHSSKFPQ